MPDPRNRRGRVEVGTITTGSDPVYDKLWEEEPNKDLPQQPEEPNDMMSFVRQYAQGFTGDFADEIAGAALSNLGPSGRQGLERVQRFFSDEEYTPEQIAQRQTAAAGLTYREGQQAAERISDRDREENPYVSLGGNIAGGLTAGVMGSRAVGSMGPTSLRTAASARPRTLAQAGGTTSYGQEILRRLPAGITIGAAEGALVGAGGSQGNLDTEEGRQALTEDVQRGTALGAGFGGVGAVLGGGANAYLNRRRNVAAGLPARTEDVAGDLIGSTPEQTLSGLQTRMTTISDDLMNNPALQNTDIPLDVYPTIRLQAARTLQNLGTGSQPKLKRIARNLGIIENQGYTTFAQFRNYLEELNRLAQEGSTEAQRLYNSLEGIYQDAMQVARQDAQRSQRYLTDAVESGRFNVTEDSPESLRTAIGATDEAAMSIINQNINSALTQVANEFRQDITAIDRIVTNQQMKEELQRIARLFQREMASRGGQGASGFSPQQLLQRYVSYSLTQLPIARGDIEYVKPFLAQFFSRVVGPMSLNPQTIRAGLAPFRSQPEMPEEQEFEPMDDGTDFEEPMQEPAMDELEEIEAELERRRELREIEAEIERRRNQGRSLRLQRRRQKRGL